VTALTGTGQLIRLALRLDRIKLTVWVSLLTLLTVTTASAFAGLYPTTAERVVFGQTIAANPAFRGLLGQVYDASTIGGLTAWRVGVILGVLGGLMGHQTVVRHTRAEEESGRLELVGAGIVGRYAPLAAALAVALGAGAVTGGAIAGALIGTGEGVAGSVALGAGAAGVIWVFAAVGAVAAQLTTSARAANGIAGAVVGAAFLLRAAGDTMPDDGGAWLSWLSPIGWLQQLRAFADERWWVLGLMVATVVVLVAAAATAVARRDIDAGLLPSRPGASTAGAGLGSPVGLAWRLQRAPLVGWAVAAVVWSAVIGAVAQSARDLLEGNAELEQILAALGSADDVVDLYIAAALGILGLGVAAYAAGTALRLRQEETSLRAEPVLATGVRRASWASSHLLFALVGPAVLLVLAGLAIGVVHGLQVGDVGGEVPRIVGAALVQLPAAWVFAGLAMLLFGVLPRASTAVWAALVGSLLIGQLGPVLELDQWVLDLSPFTHVPQLPGGELTWTPLVWLTAIAAGLLTVGMVGLRRRDVG
jgi:ABC-2 type transport system permease protein